MKKILTFTLAALAILSVDGCKNRGGSAESPASGTADTAAVAAETVIDGVSATETLLATESNMQYEPQFKIETSKGDLIVKLYEETPLHKENFIKLATNGFYDGILFHRVINGFMIQTGDPFSKDSTRVDEWGTGGPGYTVPAEIVKGFTHKKGALAAARRGDFVNPAKASSGSQFYIVQDPVNCVHLDGEYTIFGEVVKGLEIIDRIASVPTDRSDRPLEPVQIVSITPIKE